MSERAIMTNSVEGSTVQDRRAWSMITLIGVILSLSLFVVLVGILFWFTSVNFRATPLEGKTPEQKLRELQATDRTSLSNYGWVDRAKGIVRLPIDRAMTLLLEETNAEAKSVPAKEQDPQP
jgi:hypothetical protein